jgi:NAD+ synthetase
MFKDFNALRSHLLDLRGFNAAYCVAEKVRLINEFFSQEGLDSAVVGVSGGVDSALTVALLAETQKSGGPLKHVLAICIPIWGKGTTGQDEALINGWDFLKNYPNVERESVDGTRAFDMIVQKSRPTTPWAEGQLASMMRPAIFYYHAAILQTQGYKSVVVGTTNKSEGSYIGFFGKYSDGAVDIQLIGDLYKHEVYQLAKYMGLPSDVAERPARGDVYTGVSTEELMGVTYEELDTFLMLRALYSGAPTFCSQEDTQNWKRIEMTVEAWHKKNAHKYKYGTGLSAFIDVMPRKMFDGW